MKMRADIAFAENKRDKIISISEISADGETNHEVIIQRGPREVDLFDDHPGPKITCRELGLELAPGPANIRFSGTWMLIILTGNENIDVDIAPLTPEQQVSLRLVAKAIFR